MRHERYDQAGGSTDPKIAAQFFANDWLSLRGSWGTSFQAPSVFQAAGNTGSRTLTDPFRFDAQGVGRCTIGPAGEILNRGDNWRFRPHAAGLTVRHIDSYRNDEVASLPKIAAWTTLDVNYGYEVTSLPGSGEATLFLGARNLADKDPPPLPTGRDGIHRYNLRPGFDGFVHDIKGRTLYVRFRYRR